MEELHERKMNQTQSPKSIQNTGSSRMISLKNKSSIQYLGNVSIEENDYGHSSQKRIASQRSLMAKSRHTPLAKLNLKGINNNDGSKQYTS